MIAYVNESDGSSFTALHLLQLLQNSSYFGLLQLYSTPVTPTAPALQYSSYSFFSRSTFNPFTLDCSRSTVLQLLWLLWPEMSPEQIDKV